MAIYARADSPVWWMCLSVAGGRPQRRSTGIPRDAPTATERTRLRQAAESVYVREQAQLVLRERGVAPKPTRTLAAHLDWYEQHVTAHKRSAPRERELLKELRRGFGAVTLAELTLERVLEWRSARRATVSPVTVNRELDVLKHALGQAVPMYLERSPIAGLKRLSAPATAETAVLTRADEAKLLRALRPADQVVVIAALDSLIRAGDLLRLKWPQDHGRYLTVLSPKTGPSYKAPVSKRLRRALDSLPRAARDPHVFHHRRHGKTARTQSNSLKQMLEEGCKRAGVSYGRGRGITFHALRHTGASRLVEAGVDLRTVQELGGWASMRMLARYVHPTDRRKVAAVEAIGKGVRFTLRARARKRPKKARKPRAA